MQLPAPRPPLGTAARGSSKDKHHQVIDNSRPLVSGDKIIGPPPSEAISTIPKLSKSSPYVRPGNEEAQKMQQPSNRKETSSYGSKSFDSNPAGCGRGDLKPEAQKDDNNSSIPSLPLEKTTAMVYSDSDPKAIEFSRKEINPLANRSGLKEILDVNYRENHGTFSPPKKFQ